MAEAVCGFVTILAEAYVDLINTGTPLWLILLSFFGTVAILSNIFKDSTKVFGVLFIIVIATPILFFQQVLSKKKEKEVHNSVKR